MIRQYLNAVLQQDPNANPLLAFLGATLTRAEHGEATITLPVSPKLTQGGGLVAGGILATIADEAMAHAVLSQIEDVQTTVTGEMTVRFLHPADPKKISAITATATITEKTRKILTVEALVHDDHATLLAKTSAKFWLLSPK